MTLDVNYAINLFEKIMKKPYDVTFIAGLDKTDVPAHRLVMKASSKYFSALLGPNFAEGSQKKITLDEIDGKSLKAIVKYCYSHRINVNDKNADNIIIAASAMEFPDIEEIVGQHWSTKLNAENCLEILSKADTYSLQSLLKKTLILCAMEFDKLPALEKLEMDGEILQKLLGCEEFKVTEEEVFTFVMTWVEKNEEDRAKFVPNILKSIRLKHITPKFLREMVEPFYRKYDCSELVNAEYQVRATNDDGVGVKLNRFTPCNIHCANWTPNLCVPGAPKGVTITRYNFISNQWEHLCTRELECTSFSPVMCMGRLYIITGTIDMLRIRSFDMSSFRQINVHPFSVMKHAHRSLYVPVSLGKYIYILEAAYGSGSYLSACVRFDTEENIYEERQSLPVRTKICRAVELNGKIYAISLYTLFCYDPDTDEWTIHEFNANARFGSLQSLFKAGEFLYIASRYFIHQYDPVEKTWTLRENREGRQLPSKSISNAIEYRGTTYVMDYNGRFGEANLKIPDASKWFSQIEDKRFIKNPAHDYVFCNSCLFLN